MTPYKKTQLNNFNCSQLNRIKFTDFFSFYCIYSELKFLKIDSEKIFAIDNDYNTLHWE